MSAVRRRDVEDAQARVKHEEDGELPGENREREHMPASFQQADCLVTECHEGSAVPLHGPMADPAFQQRHDPRRGVSDPLGQPVARQPGREATGADEQEWMRGLEGALRCYPTASGNTASIFVFSVAALNGLTM